MRHSILAAALGLALSAATLPAASQAADRFTIGGIIYAPDSQYWQLVQRGMRDAAKDLGVDIVIGLNRRQLPVEAQVIDDFATRGVKAIVMPPLDPQASGSAAAQAKSQGVVIVDFDAPFVDATIAAHDVGVDSVQLAAKVGAEIARSVQDDFGGKATLGVITVPPTNPNAKNRRQGLAEGLGDAKVDIIGEVAASTPEQGADAFDDLLQRNPATQMIWAANSGALQGAATAAKRSGAKTKLYGIDMSRELAEALLDPAGPVEAVSDQQPYEIGYKGVEAAVKTVRGETPPRKIAVDSKLYTKRDTKALHDYLARLNSM
jgi:ribose transport system substrate-binding protein